MYVYHRKCFLIACTSLHTCVSRDNMLPSPVSSHSHHIGAEFSQWFCDTQPFGYIRTVIKGPAAPGDEGGPPPAGATGLQEKSDANSADA